MKILAIESSCDETAAAVVEDGRKVLSSVIASQVKEHIVYGGVVPEIASRMHTQAISGVVAKALEDALSISNEEYNSMALQNRQKATDMFDKNKFLQSYIKLINI